MPKTLIPRRRPREEIAAEILEAAISLFAHHGYDATTMQDVAAKVGMTAPALYYYFDSKQLLLFEVIELNLRQFNDRMEVALDRPGIDPDAAERLGVFVRAHLEFQLEATDRARVYNAMFLGTQALFDALSAPQRRRIADLQKISLDRLRAILKDGVDQGIFSIPEMIVTAMGIIAFGELAAAWYKPGGRLSVAEVANQYATLALRMVSKPVSQHRNRQLAEARFR